MVNFRLYSLFELPLAMNKLLKSLWSLNLNMVHCPVCETEQQMLRIPKNLRQTFWGGYTCQKCKTEMDKFGVLISPKNKV